MPDKLSWFWQEFRQRKVLPFLIGYIAACFAIIEFLINTSGRYSIPDTTLDLVYILSAVGLPIVIVLPWFINRKKSEAITDDLGAIQSNAQSDKSIIVLPFENISPDPDQEYFSDGLTEEIITDLSHIHDLLVISRSSAMTFKGTKKKIREIASDVSVRYVLEGSVRKSGNNLRITAQLIDANNDTHIWAEKYNGTLEDVFEIQEKVSRSIVDSLKLQLSSREEQNITEHSFENVAVYELYLKAKEDIFKFTEESIYKAIRLLEHGIQLIDDNAYLYSGLALAYWNLVNIGVKNEEHLLKSEEYSKKALVINPNFPIAHAMLGWLNFLGNQQQAVYHLKKALALNPADSFSILGLVIAYIHTGKIADGMPLMRKLKQIDPFDSLTIGIEGFIYFSDGQFDRALLIWRNYYNIDPENAYGLFWYVLILIYNNEKNEALEIIDGSKIIKLDNVVVKLALVLKYYLLNDKETILQIMTPSFIKTCQQDLTFSFHLAGIFASLNDKDEAIKWLEQAINKGFINYPLLNVNDPLLENIRGENRFQELMNRVKYEWENFEV
jgi:TolB-like protein